MRQAHRAVCKCTPPLLFTMCPSGLVHVNGHIRCVLRRGNEPVPTPFLPATNDRNEFDGATPRRTQPFRSSSSMSASVDPNVMLTTSSWIEPCMIMFMGVAHCPSRRPHPYCLGGGSCRCLQNRASSPLLSECVQFTHVICLCDGVHVESAASIVFCHSANHWRAEAKGGDETQREEVG